MLCGCAVLGAALVANLLDNNAYEPMYGLWQSEYAGLLLVGVFAWMLVERVRRLRLAADGHEEQQAEQHAPEQTPHRGGSHLGAGRHHVVLAVGAPRHDCDGLQADDEVLVEIEDLLVGGLRFRFARVTEHDERTHMMELLSMRSNTAPL